MNHCRAVSVPIMMILGKSPFHMAVDKMEEVSIQALGGSELDPERVRLQIFITIFLHYISVASSCIHYFNFAYLNIEINNEKTEDLLIAEPIDYNRR